MTTTATDGALAERLAEHLAEKGWIAPGDRLLVACSGGLDSLVLLHLFRFALPEFGAEVEAAHFDHAMRDDSAEDALWMRGLARAWGVALHADRAERTPRSEGEARAYRYRFLERTRRGAGARWVLTAHHADDQVETVLFRILRGTGLEGLRGIPEAREPAILRPLLPFRRTDLEAYARSVGIGHREDASNRQPRFTRNRIRHELLPVVEAIHPGARDAVLRLAEQAEAGVRLLDRVLGPMVEEVVAERGEGRIVLDRERLLALGEVERGEVIRRLARELGVVLTRAQTRAGEGFATEGASGGEVPLGGGLTLGRSFDRLVLERDARDGAGGTRRGRGSGARRVWKGARDGAGEGDRPLAIPGPEEGSGCAVVGGSAYRVRWGAAPVSAEAPHAPAGAAAFDPARLRFPLEVRAWLPGDRTRTPGGGKKLKKLFGELRVPAEERGRIPLLVDADGLVLWIPGRHLAPPPDGPEPNDDAWWISIAGEAP